MKLANKLLDWYGGDDLATNVLRDKYLKEGEELPEDMWSRLAKEVASYEGDSEVWEKSFYDLLKDFKFIPGGRIMYALGRSENVSCTNCYVIPIKEDSIEGIYDWLKESAMTYRSTGGVGTDISVLRPKGAPVKNSGGESPGACSFMDLMSRSTHTVHQKLRRGALMITINVHHPDVLEFINIKKILGTINYKEDVENKGYNNLYKLVEHANISVHITDEFLEALEEDKKYEQRWPIDAAKPTIKKRVSAKKIWDAIVKNAHEHAEPGIFFVDNHRRNDALAYKSPALTTNPCGEQFLGPYSNCLLGHMNLSQYVRNGAFNYDNFSQDICRAVRFLDNCISWNDGKHALPEQNETALNERRIGLGITGLGDALIKMKIKYDSDDALTVVKSIMQVYRDSAYTASVSLAKEKGVFPWFDYKEWIKSDFCSRWISDSVSSEDFEKHGIRNSFLLTCAPVGSGSIIGQVSSGIEPIFATSYSRRVRDQDGHSFTTYKTYPKIISEMFGDDDNLPEYVRTAHQIDPYYRVKLQSIIQEYVDNSISSTLNLSEETSVETVGDIYLNAWKMGLKSVTVYREGSREGVLITDKDEDKKDEEKPTKKELLPKRPAKLQGFTYKIPCSPESKLYITINPRTETPDKPYEIFISTYGQDNPELQTITVLLSALMKNVDDISFVVDHLKKIESSGTGVWWHDKDDHRRYYINSVPVAVAIALEKFMNDSKFINNNEEDNAKEELKDVPKDAIDTEKLQKCEKCSQRSWVNENGCGHCVSCGHSKCN